MAVVGWDPGMFSPSASSPGAVGSTNYYSSVVPGSANRYAVPIACEDAGSAWNGDPQSLPIGSGASPQVANLSRAVDGGDGHIVWHFNLDVYNYSLPANTFTWFALLDHVLLGGGPLPHPGQLHQTFYVNYNDFCPNGGARCLASMSGFWAGQSWIVEVNLVLTNWGDAHSDQDIVIHEPSVNYVAMDAVPMGLSIPRLTSSLVAIPWGSILRVLARRGFIDYPDKSQRWTNQNSATISCGTAVETYNVGTTAAAIADWYVWGQTLQTVRQNTFYNVDGSTPTFHIPRGR